MSWFIRIKLEAKDDLAEAFAWYERQQGGMGAQLVADVELALERIQKDPEICQQANDTVRFQRTKRFPYVVYFLLDGEEIVVIAIVHGRRDASRWQTRL